MFVVLSGELTLDQGELSETVVTAGHPFGQEVLELNTNGAFLNIK